MRMHTVYQLVLSTTMIIGVFLSGVWSPGVATAATYYVATNGNDADHGTEERPFQTIDKGLSVLGHGDTLYLREGIYYSIVVNIYHSISSGTSWANPVTIAGYPGEAVTLLGGIGIYVPDDTLQYVIFDNFTIDGAGIFVGGAGAQYIRFQNSEVKNSPRSGIGGGAGASHIEFVNLRVHDNGGDRLSHGFYVAMQYTLIDGCDIYNNGGYGIQIYDSSCTTNDCADNTTIRNSQIHDNRGDGGVTLSYGSNIVFEHNFVYNHLNGVEVSYGNPNNTRIIGNTVYNNWGGINISPSSRDAIVQDNHLSGNAGAITDYGAGTILRDNRIE